MEEKINQIKDFFTQYPHYAYLTLTLIFLVLAIGHFTNKNWAIDPPNNTHKFYYEIFGHNAYRMAVGLFFLIGTIGCSFAYFFEAFG